MPVTPGSYEVDVTWAAASTLSANVTYNVYDGRTSWLGQRRSADGPQRLDLRRKTWKSLGNFTVSGNLLTVTVANTASDGQVCADAVRILPAYQPTEMVANTYPGSWVSPTGWTTTQSRALRPCPGQQQPPRRKQSQAAWWFPCQPGQYEVDVTWQPGASYSQSVGFDVYNALTWIKQPAVNEQNAPSGVTDQGVAWQSLGIFTMTSNVLHVSTWNSPTDGAICVDGVRIVPVSASASERRAGGQRRDGGCRPGDFRAGNRCAVARCFGAVGKRRFVHRVRHRRRTAVRTVRRTVPVLVSTKMGLYLGCRSVEGDRSPGGGQDRPAFGRRSRDGPARPRRSGRVARPLDERPVGRRRSSSVIESLRLRLRDRETANRRRLLRGGVLLAAGEALDPLADVVIQLVEVDRAIVIVVGRPLQSFDHRLRERPLTQCLIFPRRLRTHRRAHQHGRR